MKKLLRAFHKRGFTLVELLVVIAIIGILVSIVLPAINNALFRGRLTAGAANGRSIVQSIIARETEGIYSSTATAWPKYAAATAVTNYQFANSTDFFRYMVTSEWMNVSYGFFAGPNIPAATSAADFVSTSDRNAWCIVGDVVDSYPDTAPVLFTRNLGGASAYPFAAMNATVAADARGFVQQVGAGAPYGQKGMVFVTKGGASFAPFKDDLKLATFTNMFLRTDIAGTGLTNTVLRPGASF